MARHGRLSPDAVGSDVMEGRGYALGRLISQIFHPILLSIASYLMVGYYGLSMQTSGLRWAGLCILAQVLPPTVFYTVRLRQGVYGDEDVSIRQQRNELYLFSIGWVLVVTIGLVFLKVPQPLLALMICTLVLGLSGGIINLIWKISVHSAAIASTATIALLYSQLLGIMLWICALAVGWARVRTRNHTPMQVLAGFCTAVVVVLVVFREIAFA